MCVIVKEAIWAPKACNILSGIYHRVNKVSEALPINQCTEDLIRISATVTLVTCGKTNRPEK